MLKTIPVEKAVGTRLAHDITEIIPGKHKGPAFRRGHVVQSEDIPRLLNLGKAHLYILDLEAGEVHEEDAAQRLARAAAGPNLRLTEPVEGRVNMIAEIDGLLKIEEDVLYRFNDLGDLILSTLHSNEYVKKDQVPEIIKALNSLVWQAIFFTLLSFGVGILGGAVGLEVHDLVNRR